MTIDHRSLRLGLACEIGGLSIFQKPVEVGFVSLSYI